MPRRTLHGAQNPHMQLDYARFVSRSAISFCRLQADILRRYIAPGVFITTNGMFGHLDNHRLAGDVLDVYTYDSYPNFAFGLNMEGRLDELRDRWSSKKLTQVRSICRILASWSSKAAPAAGPAAWKTRCPAPGR